ncbi:hypothetical protein [Rhodococcus sp. 1168]|uniref:hypothetical protein n=1 Tax=Rhodococcus sp. 1168 TaxID=2018041 RepID=UPI000F74BB33|nr:hypothetical protein [Rhodococcus sp. 1168]
MDEPAGRANKGMFFESWSNTLWLILVASVLAIVWMLVSGSYTDFSLVVAVTAGSVSLIALLALKYVKNR